MPSFLNKHIETIIFDKTCDDTFQYILNKLKNLEIDRIEQNHKENTIVANCIFKLHDWIFWVKF